MNKEQFLALDDNAKLELLNAEAAKGKNAAQIAQEIGTTKEDLAFKQGFYFVGNKFLKKPMKGYQTTQRSGNEYTDRFK